jgi:hypothetical protein
MVVDKRAPGSDGIAIAQAGYEQAGDYVHPGTEDSPDPTVLGYRGYNAILGGSFIAKYVFGLFYFHGQTLYHPNVGLGVKYDRAYLALFNSALWTLGLDRIGAGWQAGYRVNDRLTLVADGYPLAYNTFTGERVPAADIRRVRAYRLTPSLHLYEDKLSFHPGLCYLPDVDRWGVGASLSLTAF